MMDVILGTDADLSAQVPSKKFFLEYFRDSLKR